VEEIQTARESAVANEDCPKKANQGSSDLDREAIAEIVEEIVRRELNTHLRKEASNSEGPKTSALFSLDKKNKNKNTWNIY
jgi:hypothetical protein